MARARRGLWIGILSVAGLFLSGTPAQAFTAGFGYAPGMGYPTSAGYRYPRVYKSYNSRPQEPPSLYHGTVLVPKTGPAPCRIEVRLTDPQAEVWFDDAKTAGKGTVRVFESPELEPGKSYTYTIRAAWKVAGRTVTEERTITVVAGAANAVDFTRAPASGGR